MSSSGGASFSSIAEAAVLSDAVFDVDDVVSYGEVAEVGDKGGDFGFAARMGRVITRRRRRGPERRR